MSRILENIEDDAEAFVRKGIAMPERGPQWDVAVKEAIMRARINHERELLTAEDDADRRAATILGVSYDEWLRKARKLYHINDETAVVTSIAMGPDHGRTWECESQVDARRKVRKLMGYKRYDHFERGCDFAYDPDKLPEKED